MFIHLNKIAIGTAFTQAMASNKPFVLILQKKLEKQNRKNYLLFEAMPTHDSLVGLAGAKDIEHSNDQCLGLVKKPNNPAQEAAFGGLSSEQMDNLARQTHNNLHAVGMRGLDTKGDLPDTIALSFNGETMGKTLAKTVKAFSELGVGDKLDDEHLKNMYRKKQEQDEIIILDTLPQVVLGDNCQLKPDDFKVVIELRQCTNKNFFELTVRVTHNPTDDEIYGAFQISLTEMVRIMYDKTNSLENTVIAPMVLSGFETSGSIDVKAESNAKKASGIDDYIFNNILYEGQCFGGEKVSHYRVGFWGKNFHAVKSLDGNRSYNVDKTIAGFIYTLFYFDAFVETLKERGLIEHIPYILNKRTSFVRVLEATCERVGAEHIFNIVKDCANISAPVVSLPNTK